MVIFSQTFLFVIGDTSPRLNFTGLGESIFALSVGAGVGLLQLLVLRKHGGTSWSWIPANVFGFFAGRWATLALNELLTRSSYIRPEFLIRHSSSHHSFISPELLIVVAPFVTGAIVGYFTSLSLESSFGRRESEAPMNGAQS
jgi:hypothetical protein